MRRKVQQPRKLFQGERRQESGPCSLTPTCSVFTSPFPGATSSTAGESPRCCSSLPWQYQAASPRHPACHSALSKKLPVSESRQLRCPSLRFFRFTDVPEIPSLSYLDFSSFAQRSVRPLASLSLRCAQPKTLSSKPTVLVRVTSSLACTREQVEVVMGAGPQMPYPKWVWTPAGGW